DRAVLVGGDVGRGLRLHRDRKWLAAGRNAGGARGAEPDSRHAFGIREERERGRLDDRPSGRFADDLDLVLVHDVALVADVDLAAGLLAGLDGDHRRGDGDGHAAGEGLGFGADIGQEGATPLWVGAKLHTVIVAKAALGANDHDDTVWFPDRGSSSARKGCGRARTLTPLSCARILSLYGRGAHQ